MIHFQNKVNLNRLGILSVPKGSPHVRKKISIKAPHRKLVLSLTKSFTLCVSFLMDCHVHASRQTELCQGFAIYTARSFLEHASLYPQSETLLKEQAEALPWTKNLLSLNFEVHQRAFCPFSKSSCAHSSKPEISSSFMIKTPLVLHTELRQRGREGGGRW